MQDMMSLYFCRRRRKWVLHKVWNTSNALVDRKIRKRKQASKKLCIMIVKIPDVWKKIVFVSGVATKQVLSQLIHDRQLACR